ncbi:MAG: TRP repeat-containing protein [Parcubacteria group bacterium GW2011_GWA2_56_21]|nr:MAG: TRP repeat-containing protein [Parcubacteria group bacterium GW2011_GWA2_56_21]
MPPYSAAAPLDYTRGKPRRSLETISVWALSATLIVSLFAFLPSAAIPSSATKAFLLAAGALITLALFILARLSRGNIILPPFALVAALWLPTVAYALSAAFSGAPFATTLWGSALEPDTLGFMLTAAVLGTLAALVLRRSEHYRSFLTIGAVVFGLVALIQALIIIVGQFAPSAVSPTLSFVGSFDDLAFLMGLGVISILITLRFLELSRRAHRALLISGVVALFLLAIANSSVVWVLVSLVSLGLFVEAVMKRGPKAADADLDDAAMLGDTSYETDEGRHPLVLPLAVLAVSLFFIIGGTLGGEWLKHRDASLNSTVFWNVDFSSGIGFIPTSFVTTGIVGVLAWVAFFGLCIALGLRMLILRAPEDAFTRYVAILSFIAMLYLFVVAIVGLPSAVILALAFVFAGLFISTTRFAARSQQWGVVFSRSPRLGFVIVFSLTILLLASVVTAYTLVGRYIATAELAKARTALSVGDLEVADTAVQNAVSFAPSATAYQMQAGIANTRLGRIATSQTMPVAEAQRAFQSALSSGINAALTATRLAPSDYQNWLALGNLYAQAVPLGVSGAYDSAKTSYEKAQALNPTNPQIPYILAQLDIANKDIKAAKENLKASITLKQDYTTAIFLLSQLEVQDGNLQEALTAALAAAYFTPNDPYILFQVGILYAAQNDFANAAAALGAAVAANQQFANARYFLGAVYAKQGDLTKALAEMQAIAAMSSDNAAAVASQLAALESGRNPFPANLLSIAPAP